MRKIYTRHDVLKLLALGLILSGFAGVISGCAGLNPKNQTSRFVFFTDVHANTKQKVIASLARAANKINDLKPDFIVGGGDLVSGGFRDNLDTVSPRWDVYAKFHQMLNAKVYSTLGNHDLVAAKPRDGSPAADDPRFIFKSRLSQKQTYYSFDHNGHHFMVLDSIYLTNDKYMYHGFIPDPQMQWIKNDLANISKEMPIVIITHIPLVTSFFSITDGASTAARPDRVIVNNAEVLDQFKDHKLLLVLQGHLHIKERIDWRNTTFISGGAISGKWWQGSWHGTAEGFNLLTISGDRVEWDYIEYN